YNHRLVALTVFFNWCRKRRYITDNPTLGLSSHRRPARARILSDNELKLIWNTCEQRGANGEGSRANSSDEAVDPLLPASFCKIVQLLVLTGQRRSEIASLRPAYFSHNEQTICLPSELTKNAREHTFPLGL